MTHTHVEEFVTKKRSSKKKTMTQCRCLDFFSSDFSPLFLQLTKATDEERGNIRVKKRGVINVKGKGDMTTYWVFLHVYLIYLHV
jgi:hypothetical protein